MAEEAKSKWNGFSLKPRREMPEGLWLRCLGCEQMLYKSSVEKNLHVCPECDYHFRIDAATRIKYLADEDSFQEMLADLTTSDPLGFKFRGTTYKQRVKADQKKSGAKEAMRIGKAFIKGRGIILAVMEPNFLMGSMGFVVGEKFCAAVDAAMEGKLPLVVVS
jgi:acetyl-CoA carboxylase carboxyl transferase subunit beta